MISSEVRWYGTNVCAGKKKVLASNAIDVKNLNMKDSNDPPILGLILNLDSRPTPLNNDSIKSIEHKFIFSDDYTVFMSKTVDFSLLANNNIRKVEHVYLYDDLSSSIVRIKRCLYSPIKTLEYESS